MDPIQIVLAALALAGVWALVELALVLRRTRSTVDSLNQTVGQLNETLTEARPMVAKLDGALDDLQPAIAQVDPIMKQLTASSEALSADLLEVNGILRDVSQVTGTMSDASGAVSSITDAATEKVQRILGKRGKQTPSADRALREPSAPAGDDKVEPAVQTEPEPQQYFTYGSDAAASVPSDSKEDSDV